jgi:peptidoglycan LD-endopeptidase LytH
MTRLGWWLLLGFAVVIAAFFAFARFRDGGRPVALAPAAPPPAIAVPPIHEKAPIIPVEGVAADQLTDTWGQQRGDDRTHQALDIMAPRGTPVIAATDGTVEKLFESNDGGHTLYVRRNDIALQDYYAHLDSYAPGLSEGMKVKQGQVLGAVGSTGSASEAAPHLHYEIHVMTVGDEWWQGRAINPYPILAAQAAGR